MLNYEFPPLGGGGGNATFYILKEFAQYKDLQIDLITSSVNKYREEQFSDDIRIYYLDIGKKGSLHYQTNRDLLSYACKSYFFYKGLLKENTHHLCHTFFGIPCGFIASKLNIPYIVSLRGSDVPFYNPRFYWLDKLFFRHLSKKIWRNSLAVIANSKGLKGLALKNLPDQKIDVICNGVDTNQFRPNFTKSDTLRMLCVSRLIKRKGIVYLIKAIAELRQNNVNLVIVGQGTQEEKLKRLVSALDVSSKVEFKNYIAHDSINEIYHNSDVFILPSLSEGMNNAALEAMACGLPVVLTDTGGSAELVNGNGFIIGKKDHLSIARALQKFLQDRELIGQMGKRSREIAESMSWRNIAEGYYRLYNDVCK